MNRMAIAFLVGCLCCAATVRAGWRDAVRKVERGVEKRVDKEVKRAAEDTERAVAGEKAEPSKQGTTGTAASSGSDQAGSGQSYPPRKANDSRKYPPGLSFATVLNGVKLLPKDGQFQLYHIQATFLPEDGRTGFAVLRIADGKAMYRFDYKSEAFKKPYFLLDFWKATDLTNGKNLGAGRVDLAKPGDYVVDFYTPSEHFYTFPFSVRKAGSDDPFGEGDAWLIDGDWRDLAYLYYVDADPTKPLVWKVWLRKDGPGELSVKPLVQVVREGETAPVCVSRDITLNLKPDWIRYELDMIFPPKGTSGGAYFKAKDLVGTDGAYTLTMKLGDKDYGAWKFRIAGGKPVPAGRTERGKADALTFVEGGRDAFWFERVK